MNKKKHALPLERAGYKPRHWCELVSIGRSTLDELPPEKQPHSVKLGRRRVITESPAAWLARVGKQA